MSLVLTHQPYVLYASINQTKDNGSSSGTKTNRLNGHGKYFCRIFMCIKFIQVSSITNY